MDLSIIIVNYKSTKKTLVCLESIYNSKLDNLSYEVLVVDNDSKDGVETDVKSKYPQVKFIQSGKNLGMGQGNNLGINHSRGNVLVCLNADTILKPNCILTLYDYIMRHSEVGIVAPKLLNTDGTLQYSCFREYNLFTPLYRRTFLGRFNKKHLDRFLMKDFDHNAIREVAWVMGSCLVARKEVINKVGMFDDAFFMYFEDTDLCRRMRARGYKVMYNPNAELVHDHGRGSAKEKWYIAPFKSKLAREHIKSWIKYFIKWRKNN